MRKMKYLTDQFQLFFCFCIGNTIGTMCACFHQQVHRFTLHWHFGWNSDSEWTTQKRFSRKYEQVRLLRNEAMRLIKPNDVTVRKAVVPGRNEGGAIPRAPKSPNNVTSTFIIQYVCFRKTLISNMGVPNLLPDPAPSNLVTPLSGSRTFCRYGPFHCTQNCCGPPRFVNVFSFIE